MDLRTGCEFWSALGGHGPAYPPLADDRECDVAVIGSGITGALAAMELIKAGMKLIILDRRQRVGGGSTTASTGLLQYEVDRPLVELSRIVGKAAAERAYVRGVEAVARFGEIVGAIADGCGYERKQSLFIACGEAAREVELLRAEAEARRAAGIDVEFLDAAAMRNRWSFSCPAAILSGDAAQIDPYRFTWRLIEASAAAGVEVYSSTEVIEYVPDERGVTLRTAQGWRVRAGHVVFATGYETPPFLDCAIASLKSTYAVVTEPVATWEGWRDRVLIWETGTPYFYARTTPDGRVMAGGEDEPFADPGRRDALIAEKARVLEQKIRRMFPAIEARVSCAWAGTFAETKDALPYIGPHPKFPRGQFALGYGGNGITFGMIAAGLIRDALTGVNNADLELFRFDR